MGAVVEINTVSTRVKDVPFGVAVSLLNASLGGVTSQKWEVTSYSQDIYGNEPDPVNYSGWTLTGKIFSRTQSGSFPAVTFIPDISGNYIIRLTDTSNGDPLLWTVQTAVVRVKDQLSGGFIPAPGENDEVDADRGWALERNQDLRIQGRSAAYGSHIRILNLTGSTLTRGKIAKVIGFTDMHTVGGSAVPAGATVRRERIAKVSVASSNDIDAVGAVYVIVVEPDGILNNGTGYAMRNGVFEGVNPSSGTTNINFSGFTVSDLVYLNTTGDVASTPSGSNTVVIGQCIENGSDGDMLFDGSHSSTLTSKFIVQGTADSQLANAQFLGALGSGLLYNTTTTGVLSTAIPGVDHEVPLTFSTPGNTRTGSNVTADYITGKAGNQIWNAGFNANDGLTINASVHTTKGPLRLNAARMGFNRSAVSPTMCDFDLTQTFAQTNTTTLDAFFIRGSTVEFSANQNINAADHVAYVSIGQPTFDNTVGGNEINTVISTLWIEGEPLLPGWSVADGFALYIKSGDIWSTGHIWAINNIFMANSSAQSIHKTGAGSFSVLNSAGDLLLGTTGSQSAIQVSSVKSNVGIRVMPGDFNRFRVNSTQSVPIAASATLDAVYFDPSITTLTAGVGSVITTALGFNQNVFAAPTYNGSATVTYASTVVIDGPPSGTATITNPYVLWTQSGTTRHDGSLRVNLTNDTTGSIPNWDSRHSVFGVGGIGNSPGFGFHYSTTFNQGFLSVLEPGIAWRAFRLQATQFDYYANGTVNTFSIVGGTALTAQVNVNALLTVTPGARSAGSPRLIDITGPAHTTLAASTEAIDIRFGLGRTVQFATGALATQRAVVIEAPTYGFVGPSTITTAATLAITGAPIALGPNATITQSLALWIQAGDVRIASLNGILTGTTGVVGVASPTTDYTAIITLTAGAGLTGGGTTAANRTFDVVANADNSIVVNANDIQVGVLATDAQHGNRGGGGIHAVATTSVAGFLSAADKSTLANSKFFVGSSTNAPASSQNLGVLTTGLLMHTVSGGISTIATAIGGTNYQVPLTFSTGLSGVTTITANITTGTSGGQTATGGSGTGENLTLRSNVLSNGNILLSSANNGFNESTGNFYLGTSTPISTALFHMTRNSNALTELFTTNPNTAGAAGATHRVGLDIASDTTKFLGMTILGTSFTTAGLLAAQVGLLEHNPSNSANLLISQFGGGDLVITTGGSRTQRARLLNNGHFHFGPTGTSDLAAFAFSGSTGSDTVLFAPQGGTIPDNSSRNYFTIAPFGSAVSDAVVATNWIGVDIRPSNYTRAGGGTTPSVVEASTVRISGEPSFSGSFTVTRRYAMHQTNGVSRFDAGSASENSIVVWEVPSYDPSLSLQTSGLTIPVRVTGGSIYYLELMEPIA